VSPQASQFRSSPLHSFNLGKQETISLFEAYIGGLFVADGADTVNDWIDHLLLQENFNLKKTCEEEPLQSLKRGQRAKQCLLYINPLFYLPRSPLGVLHLRDENHFLIYLCL
jgi:hypothetical protein